MAMDRRSRIMVAVVGLLVLVAAAIGYATTRSYKQKDTEVAKAEAPEKEERLQDACASTATYARLKEVAFEEAVRIRNADPANLDTLAAHSVVRMENPVVKNRDDELNVTVCKGRFVLELPPGSEAGFGGERRLVADIEYASQSAADGSGLVYQMSGAEPIIYRLANFQLRGPPREPPAAPLDDTQLAEAPEAPIAPSPDDAPPARFEPRPAPPAAPQPKSAPKAPAAPRPAPAPRAEPREPVRTATARPSFDCRYARTRGEKMVCSSDRLAAKDRAMSSLFYSALADADRGTRITLRRTRDRFLAYRDRCGNEGCVAEAYDGRMDEIRDIMAEGD